MSDERRWALRLSSFAEAKVTAAIVKTKERNAHHDNANKSKASRFIRFAIALLEIVCHSPPGSLVWIE
jgi:hypothetical protein